ncbi:MAG: hypothetical protein QG591_1457, partial [Planctomycetota bacterium]|nr:hypothetical protein [Planctomycetota bacterium]
FPFLLPCLMPPNKIPHLMLLTLTTILHTDYTSPLLPLNTYSPDSALCTLYPHTTRDSDTLSSILSVNTDISYALHLLYSISASDISHTIPSPPSTALPSCGLPHDLPFLTTLSAALPHKTDTWYNTHLSVSSTEYYMHSPQLTCNKNPNGISPTTHIDVLHLSSRGLHLPATAFPQPLSPTFFFIQSNSTFSCPICWYNDDRNSSSFLASCTFFIENIRGTSSTTCFFHCAICVGCTPYSPVSSFTVFSPFIASIATLALNSPL